MRMDSTVRILWQRVQILIGSALFFLAASAFCSEALSSKPALTATAAGNVLRVFPYGRAGQARALELPGRITAVAVSGNGQAVVIAAATASPYALHLFDAALQPLQRLALVDRSAKLQSAVCSIHVAASRQSFVVLFSGMPELWEVSYNPSSPEIGLGMVHDFQYREGHFVPGYLHPLRTALPFVLGAAALGDDGHTVMLRERMEPGAVTQPRQTLIHLDVRKPIAPSGESWQKLQECRE